MTSIALTDDDKYLFVSTERKVNQYRVNDHALVKTYKFICHVTTIITTLDNKYVFVGHEQGGLSQICIDTQESKH